MGQSSQSTQSTTQTSPWAPQIPYLTQGFQNASNAFNTAGTNANNPNYAAPSQFTANITPQQLSLFNQMVGYGSNNAVPGQETAAGTNLMNLGTNATTQALSGLEGYNPSSTNNLTAAISGGNQYSQGANIPGQVQAAMQAANEEARDVTLPGIASGSQVASNGANNSRTALSEGVVQRGLAEQAGNLAASLGANYYNTGAGLAENINAANNPLTLQGLMGLSQAGGGNNTLGLGALSQGVENQGQIYNIGGSGGQGLYEAAQAPLTNQQQGYQFGQTSPFIAPQEAWNIIGSNQWGGTSNTTANTTYTPSLASTLAGGIGAASSLFGSAPTMFGGGSGLMGMFPGMFGMQSFA